MTSSRALAQPDLPTHAVADRRAPVAGRQTTSAFATLREYFTRFDDAGMAFTFATLDLPFFLTRAENTTRVLATSDRTSRVVFDVEMDLWGPFALGAGRMKSRFTRAMQAVHADLRRVAEARVYRDPRSQYPTAC